MSNRAEDQTVYIRVNAEEIAQLDAIAEQIAKDPRSRVLKRKIGRPDAFRAAVRHYIENPPTIEES